MKPRVYFIVLIAIAAAGATWFYQSRQIDRQKISLATERARAARLQQQLTQIQQQRDEALHAAADAERELHSLPLPEDAAADPVRSAQTKSWLARLKQLRQSFADLPSQAIPELKLLTDLDWLTLARTISVDSELDLRKARAAARTSAIKRFTPSLGAALGAYTAAHEGNLPTDIAQLLPYFKTPVDPDLLQRYAVTASGNTRTMKGEALGERAPVDTDFDPYHWVGAKGGSSSTDSWAEAHYNRAAYQAMGDFAAANNGQAAKTAAELLPYVRDQTVRPIIEARVRFVETNSKNITTYQQLHPYVNDPATSAFLEKLIAAEQKTRSP